MSNNDFGSIGWSPPNIPGPHEIVGWGNEIVGSSNFELIGWGNELIGYANPEIIGCPGMQCHDGEFGAGTDDAWFAGAYDTETTSDDVGIFPLIIAGIAAVATIASSAAQIAKSSEKVVKAVGGAVKVAKYVKGGVGTAQKLIEAAQKGDKASIAKLKGVEAKQKRARVEAREKAKKKLAEVAIRAKQGDLKAQAILAGIQIIKNRTNQKVAATASFMQRFRTPPTKRLLNDAVNDAAAKDWQAFQEEAIKIAKKSGKWPKSNPPVVLPVKAMVRASNHAGIAMLKRGNAKLKARRIAPGASGFLVTQGGRVRSGKWLPAV